MKKSLLQTGVVYAFQPGKHDTVKPVVLVSLNLFDSNFSRWGAENKPGTPKWKPSTESRPGSYFDKTTGYLAISTEALRYSSQRAHEPLSLEALTQVTLAQVLEREVHGYDHGEDGTTGYIASVVNNSAIIGLYDEVIGVQEREARETRRKAAERSAEAVASYDAASARWDAFQALGVVLPRPSLDDVGYGDEKHQVSKHADRVTLDAATLDQILALLQPEV